jgi:CRP-like cAMP-binding protein
MFRCLAAIHPLPPGGRDKLLALLSIQDLPKDGFFLRRGETPVRVGYMTSGWLRYFQVGESGREYIRYFCSGGNFVSAQTALINGEPSEFSIQAVESSRLVVFEYREWLALMEKEPVWAIIHKAILDKALQGAERRERSLILDDAITRYLGFLEEYPDAEAHLKQYEIASYLGLSPVTLSRIRGRKASRRKNKPR